MKTTSTAPQRAGTRKTITTLAVALKQLEHEPEAAGLVVQLVEALAEISRISRR
jgi:hypothetical protein